MDEELVDGNELVNPLLDDNTTIEGTENVQDSPELRFFEQPRCVKFLGCGVIFGVLLASLLPVLIESFIQDGIRGDVVIDSKKADGYGQFIDKRKTGDNTIEFYFFEIENPEQVLEGEKPSVVEIGPFIYQAYQTRVVKDDDWDHVADTLRYEEHAYYVFDAKRTKAASGYDTDQVHILTMNMLFIGMKSIVGVELWHAICDFLLWKNDFDRLFANRTVVDYLNGYSETARIQIPFIHKDIIDIPIPFPGIYPNNTVEHAVMRVGANDINKVYEMVEFQGMKSVETQCPYGVLPFFKYCPHNFPCCRKHPLKKDADYVPIWGTEIFPGEFDADANLVHGRNGEQFQPGITKDTDLIIFNDIIWRALHFRNDNGEERTFKGIKMLRFSPVPSMFANVTERPANGRYYQYGPYGFLGNMSMVEQGCEIYASLPHFLYGDKRLINGVKGLNPNKEKHRMVIDIEPTIGQTMIEHVRAQINVKLSKADHWNWFKNVRDGTYVPVGWFDVVSIITDEGVSEFNVLIIAKDIKKVCIGLGTTFAILCTGPILLAFRSKLRKDQQKI